MTPRVRRARRTGDRIDPYGCELFHSEHKLSHEEIDAELLNGVGWAVVHPATMIRAPALARVADTEKSGKGRRSRRSAPSEIENSRTFSELLHTPAHESINRTRSSEQARLADACVRDAYRRRGKHVPHGWKFVPKPRPAKDVQLRTWAWKALGSGNVPAARKHAVALWKAAPLSVESWRTLLCAMRGY